MQQFWIEGDLHAVTRDRQQVVVVIGVSGTDALAADTELLNLFDLFGSGRYGDMDFLAIGHLEVHILLRDDIRKGSIGAHELGKVMELREALFQLEAVALRFNLHRVLNRPERERPGRKRR